MLTIIVLGLASAIVALGQAINYYTIPTAGSDPNCTSGGPDGNLRFTETDGKKIGRVTTSGSFTEFLLPTPVIQPLYIAAGPDGNLWFTEFSNQRIGQITPKRLAVRWRCFWSRRLAFLSSTSHEGEKFNEHSVV